MNNLDNLQLIQNANEKAVLEKLKLDDVIRATPLPPGIVWRWKPPLTMLIQPQFSCEVCGLTATINLYMVVDTERNCVVRAFSFGRGMIQTYSSFHPHVNTNGHICMGNSPSTIVALSSGIRQRSSYFDLGEFGTWLTEFTDHPDCGDSMISRSEENDEDYRHCVECDTRMHMDSDECFYSDYYSEYYCENHYYDLHWNCGYCYSTFANEEKSPRDTPRGDEACPDCFDHRFFECLECQEVYPRDDARGPDSNTCMDCYEEEEEEYDGVENE